MNRLLFSLLLVVLLCSPLFAESASLSVRGQAHVEASPDRLELSLGVSTQGASSQEALARNSELVRAVEAALLEAGIDKGELKTGQFSIYPVWGKNRKSDREQPEGYRVHNSLALKTGKLALASRIIEVAARAGANEIGALRFSLEDEGRYRREVIALATVNARRDAETLAEAGGVTLVRLLSVQLDNASVMPFQPGMLRTTAMAMEAAPPITEGPVRLDAQVQLIFEIAPAARP